MLGPATIRKIYKGSKVPFAFVMAVFITLYGLIYVVGISFELFFLGPNWT